MDSSGIIDVTQDPNYKQAARDLALKLKLEAKFKKELRSFFKDLSAKLKDAYSASGIVPPANMYKNDMKKILTDNYKIISKNFESQIRMGTKSFEFIETKAMDHDINTEITKYISAHSETQSNLITQTNHDRMTDAVDKVKQTALKNSTPLSNREIAEQASMLFQNDGLRRANTIATTETQNIAETSKFIEAQAVSKNLSNGLYSLGDGSAMPGLSKVWVTVLDERTRISHVIADGQKRAVSDPFDVEGEKLMTPGDTSLGAGPGNVINCRCSVAYNVINSASEVADIAAVTAAPDEYITEIQSGDETVGLMRGVIAPYNTEYNNYTLAPNALDNYIIEQKLKYASLPLRYYGEDEQFVDLGVIKFSGMSNSEIGLEANFYLKNITDEKIAPIYERIKKGELKGLYPVIDNITNHESHTDANGVKKILIKRADIKEVLLFDQASMGTYPNASLLPINTKLPSYLVSESIVPADKYIAPSYASTGVNIKEIEKGDSKYGFVKGYVSINNNLNANNGIVLKDAFAGSIAESSEKYRTLPMYLEHDPNKKIGYFPYSAMKSDNYGLYAEGYVDLSTPEGREIYEQVKKGDLSAFSVGFTDVEEDIYKNIAITKKADLHEISLVANPANRKAVMLPVEQEYVARVTTATDEIAAANAKPELPEHVVTPEVSSPSGTFATKDEAERAALLPPFEATPTGEVARANPELDQRKIVENLKNGIPNGPNPKTIIVNNIDKEFAYIQGNIAKSWEVSRDGYI